MSRSRAGLLKTAVAIVLIASAVLPLAQAHAQTLEAALIFAYQNNPTLNAQRALVRATDENVPQALAGYRPRASLTANAGYQSLTTRTLEIGSTTPPGGATIFNQSGANVPRGVGATITQNLFNGFQTANRTRQAESQVLAARETLRATEQTVMQNVVTAYMNLLRELAILSLQRSNMEVLEEQLRQTRTRLESGNVTATDVSQAESRLAVGRIQVFSAEANLATARAVFRQVVGFEAGQLVPASSVDRFSPNTLPAAIEAGTANHPTVITAQHNLDVAVHQVKVAEGVLYPTVTLQGNVQKNYDTTLTQLETFSASAVTQLSVPLYQGGAEYSAIRQAKETQGQRRLDLDAARDQARVGVIQAWATLEASKRSITSATSQVTSAEAALNGVREEARLGQRTTLDVLNAQQELVNARIALVTAQRDRVVNSYALLAAIGRLAPEVLGLSVPLYSARVHYHQVRDAWGGVRTPDGH
jgi:outer membrane protein